MRAVGRILPVFAGLLIVLTYLLVRGATPDAALHERTLAALRALILNDAALHRDVLRARAGLLRNYDPLVQSVSGLRAAIDDLAAVRAIASDEAGEEIGDRLAGLAAAVADQEDLVEQFKSDNALLQNSLSYFNYASREFARRAEDAAAAEAVGALANGMLRFTSDPSEEAAGEVAAGLDRLASLPPVPASAIDTRALVAHGRLIVSAQPAVDGLVRRLLAAPIGPRARLLQDLYLDAHGRAVARASLYRILLYAAAVMLAGYLGYLFLRLRANARSLEARLRLESLIAEISTRFINLPRERLGEGISRGLAVLADHAGVDRAYILLHAGDGAGLLDHRWQRDGLPAADDTPDGDLLDTAFGWSTAGYERQACIHVPDVVELPTSAEKTALTRRGIRSWLCIPLRRTGRRVGLLGLDAVRDVKTWQDDDIALLRTAGEIFLNALERERADSEREALAERLRQAQRIEAIGTLAGGIAHNFNNILGAILGYSEMALNQLPKDSRPWRQVREVRKAGRRAKDLVDQILTFGRHGGHRRAPVQMPALVSEAVGLLRGLLPPTVEIDARILTDAAVVTGDAAQLQQVIMNLCTNAAQAMDGRGSIDVALDVVELDAPRMLSHGNLAAGCYVRLAVTDRGLGMDARTLERIFEPFFTTKPPGVGTGLGLASVHGIVADHGGALNVRSRPGAGSTFEAYVAATDAARLAEERPEAPLPPSGRGETVLLVDDDRPLMLLGEEMLAALGYEPAGFDSSPQALAAFRADPARFDLVLADEVMPAMTGSELAAAVHELRPELPIILVTGYGVPMAMGRLRAAGVCEVLKKPLSSAELAAALARHLGPAAAPSAAARLSQAR